MSLANLCLSFQFLYTIIVLKSWVQQVINRRNARTCASNRLFLLFLSFVCPQVIRKGQPTVWNGRFLCLRYDDQLFEDSAGRWPEQFQDIRPVYQTYASSVSFSQDECFWWFNRRRFGKLEGLPSASWIDTPVQSYSCGLIILISLHNFNSDLVTSSTEAIMCPRRVKIRVLTHTWEFYYTPSTDWDDERVS